MSSKYDQQVASLFLQLQELRQVRNAASAPYFDRTVSLTRIERICQEKLRLTCSSVQSPSTRLNGRSRFISNGSTGFSPSGNRAYGRLTRSNSGNAVVQSRRFRLGTQEQRTHENNNEKVVYNGSSSGDGEEDNEDVDQMGELWEDESNESNLSTSFEDVAFALLGDSHSPQQRENPGTGRIDAGRGSEVGRSAGKSTDPSGAGGGGGARSPRTGTTSESADISKGNGSDGNSFSFLGSHFPTLHQGSLNDSTSSSISSNKQDISKLQATAKLLSESLEEVANLRALLEYTMNPETLEVLLASDLFSKRPGTAAGTVAGAVGDASPPNESSSSSSSSRSGCSSTDVAAAADSARSGSPRLAWVPTNLGSSAPGVAGTGATTSNSTNSNSTNSTSNNINQAAAAVGTRSTDSIQQELKYRAIALQHNRLVDQVPILLFFLLFTQQFLFFFVYMPVILLFLFFSYFSSFCS
jgi:hypothetical protein